MNHLTDLIETLAGFAVHTGFPEQRAALAGQLLADGVSVADVEALGSHCEKMIEGEANAIRVLLALLQDPEKRTARLADLATVAAAKLNRKAKTDGGPNQHFKVDAGPEEIDHDRKCYMVYCRVVADRKEIRFVANEFGLPLDSMPAMIARGRELTQPRVAPVKQEPVVEGETHADRVQRFLESMRRQKAST